MKLIIQIPCYNEEETLSETLKSLPKKVEGFDKVEWLVINDGSLDNTIQIAKDNGVDHIIHFCSNQGLAKVFMAGLDASLKLGADVIVNTDADNQYDAKYIHALTRPILEGKADMVIGERPILKIKDFSILKKFLQKIGSLVVRMVSNTSVPDAPSGFRALTKETAMKLNVFNDYTYTLETIIQAGQKKMTILSVPVEVNKVKRPSRLVKNIFQYIRRSIITIIRIFVIYQPFKFFMTLGSILFSIGVLLGIRFLYLVFILHSGQRIQSVILTGVFLGFGVQTMLTAFIADLLATNRKLSEDIQYRLRKMENGN